MKILIATHSAHKAAELKHMLTAAGIDAVTLADIDPQDTISAPEETGSTLQENARLKAHYYARYTSLPVLADDTGLEVPALKGEPGVRTGRYAGEHATAAENRAKLLKALVAIPEADRTAFFKAVLYYYDGDIGFSVEGSLQGRIATSARGENGFAYDPIFELPAQGKTYGELTAEEKNSISHRALAAQAFIKKWKALNPSYNGI